MEVVCNRCGKRRNVGDTIQSNSCSIYQKILVCLECGSDDVKLVDNGVE